MGFPIDLTTAATSPFTKAPAHELLSGFVGRWRGAGQLWVEPGTPPETSVLELSAQLVLGGRWLRLVYQGSAFGAPHAGEMLLGFHKDEAKFELAWVDSAHTGSSILVSTGAGEPSCVDVLGSYQAAGQRWGWRTRLHRPSSGTLALDAFNVEPGGAEHRALAWLLERAA